jgi:hypothetical protein
LFNPLKAELNPIWHLLVLLGDLMFMGKRIVSIFQYYIQQDATLHRNSNGTKHSGGPPEDGREKRPKHVGVLYLQARF